MLSSSTFLQRAARHAPRRPLSSAPTFGVSSRSFSASVIARQNNNAQPNSPGDNVDLINSLNAADTTGHGAQPISQPRSVAGQHRGFRPLQDQTFLSPGDFGAKARLYIHRPYRRPSLLGPPRAEAEQHDIFRKLDIDPVKEATNSALMSAFVSELGRIHGRAETKLTWRSQRKLGKAIRRAKMMGVIPLHSRRPLFDLKNSSSDKQW